MSNRTKKMTASIDITLEIPAHMRGIFPNKSPMVLKFETGVPKEVPHYVAEYYSKGRPHVFTLTGKIQNSEKTGNEFDTSEKTGTANLSEKTGNEFDPVQFLEASYQNIDESLDTLARKEIIELTKFLKLSKNPATVKTAMLKQKISHDIAVKLKQDEELKQHKEASSE